MLNLVAICGRLTRDCEQRFTQSGTAVGNFTLAVDRPKYKDREKETDFIDCVLWGKQCEGLAQYLTKGKPIAVTGALQVRQYEAQDGTKRKVAEVRVDKVSFLPDAKKDQQSSQQSSTKGFGSTIDFDPDDIPFSPCI